MTPKREVHVPGLLDVKEIWHGGIALVQTGPHAGLGSSTCVELLGREMGTFLSRGDAPADYYFPEYEIDQEEEAELPRLLALARANPVVADAGPWEVGYSRLNDGFHVRAPGVEIDLCLYDLVPGELLGDLFEMTLADRLIRAATKGQLALGSAIAAKDLQAALNAPPAFNPDKGRLVRWIDEWERELEEGERDGYEPRQHARAIVEALSTAPHVARRDVPYYGEVLSVWLPGFEAESEGASQSGKSVTVPEEIYHVVSLEESSEALQEFQASILEIGGRVADPL